jgi:hypothetical protein
MLIQRGGATTHRVMDSDVNFNDFYEMVHFENFGESMHPDESKRIVFVPHTDTTYTLLAIHEAKAC